MASNVEIDRDRAKKFTARLLGLLDGAAVVHMIAMGNRVGLFDAMAPLGPATSDEVASAAGLRERYVREWLGAMTTGGVVEYDAGTGTYRLPPEHAASLTTAAGPRNLSGMAKSLTSFGQVEPQVAACFREGGGVPYTKYAEFHRIQRELSGAVQDALLVDAVLPLVDGLVDRLTSGIEVADVGCGAGHAVNLMANAFPASRFIGYDFSDEAVAMASAEAEALGLVNASFEAKDAAELGEVRRFDFMTTFDAIHDQAKPAVVLAAIAEALKDDGTWLCVDVAGSSHLENNVGQLLAPFFYAGSTMHCMTVSLAYDGEGLGSMWGEERARQMFTDAGFTSIDVRKVRGDAVNNYYICRK